MAMNNDNYTCFDRDLADELSDHLDNLNSTDLSRFTLILYSFGIYMLKYLRRIEKNIYFAADKADYPTLSI